MSEPLQLHRRLFSRLKRIKSQPSSGSSSGRSSPAPGAHLAPAGDEMAAGDCGTDGTGLATAAAGESGPVTGSPGPAGDCGPRRAGHGESGLNQPPAPPSANKWAASGPLHEEQEGGRRAAKPSRKSRALQLFRRAAAGIRSSSDEPSSRTSPRRAPRSGRLASLALRLNSSRLSHSNSLGSQLNGSPAGDERWPRHAGLLPKFIVPKTNALSLPVVCLVRSLEGELMREVSIHRYELGQYLVANLEAALGFRDSKYFGLRLARRPDDQEDVRQPWLELNEPVYKQIGRHKQPPGATGPTCAAPHQAKCVELYLRFKYYPPNLARLQDPFVRQYLWLQLRRDLRLGKLTSSMGNLTLLMACVLQHQLGDYRPELVDQLQALDVLPNQDLIEAQAVEYWRDKLRGCKRHQVQMQFLRAALILETYGFDYYPVRDHQRQRAYLLGFNYNGVKTIRNGRIVHHFRWHSLSTISHERRMIIFHVHPTENSRRKQIVGFKCLSNDDCQTLYMRLLEQRYFFTVDLAYFDKSVRRPSCLEPGAGAAEWPAAGAALASSLSISSAGQQHESAGFSDAPPPTDSFDSRDPDEDGSGCEFALEAELGQRTANGQQLSDASCREPSSAAPTGRLHGLADQFRARAAQLEKASSLQEPGSLEALGCRAPQSSLSFAAPGSAPTPSLSSFSHCSELSGQPNNQFAAFGARPPTGGGAARGNASHAPPLRRQLSTSQYSSCNLVAERPAQFDELAAARRRQQQQQQEEPPAGTIVSTPEAMNCTAAACPISRRQDMAAVHRLAELANWLLAPWRPAQLSGPLGEQPLRAEQARANPSPNARGLMQAVRFCLIILLMNFLIRLTDNLTGNLVELLSVGGGERRPRSAPTSGGSLLGGGHFGT